MRFPKNPPPRDEAYKEWLRGCVCAVFDCTYSPSEPSHVGRTGKGMAQKGSDLEAVPMCFRHHAEYHRRGQAWFAREYRVNYERLIAKYRARYAEWVTSS